MPIQVKIYDRLGDVINQFRKGLDLEEVAMLEGPDLAQMLQVPFTYCWSPALVPKPTDWPCHIDVCGFFFRETPQYEPPPELHAFLNAGPPPIYIGFGSIVLEDSKRMTAIILQAVEATNTRAVISKGWSNLGGTHDDKVVFIGDCPHEWLFQHIAAVVHHGGAGTTACGLRNGKPTAVVPFFGDQPFWGNMVAAAGAGPTPVPHKELTADKLGEAIRYCLSSEAATAALAIAEKMKSETGVQAAMESFHRNLPLERLHCGIFPHLPAAWSFSKGKKNVKLSKIAAETLLLKMPMDRKYIALHEANPIFIENRRRDPITGGSSAVMTTVVDLTACLLGTFIRPYQAYQLDRKQRTHSAPSKVSDDSTHATPSTSTPKHTSDAMSLAKEFGNGNSMASAARVTSTSEKSHKHTKRALVGKMAGASAKSLGDFIPTALKGMTVDIPLALTEGLRNVP